MIVRGLFGALNETDTKGGRFVSRPHYVLWSSVVSAVASHTQ